MNSEYGTMLSSFRGIPKAYAPVRDNRREVLLGSFLDRVVASYRTSPDRPQAVIQAHWDAIWGKWASRITPKVFIEEECKLVASTLNTTLRFHLQMDLPAFAKRASELCGFQIKEIELK